MTKQERAEQFLTQLGLNELEAQVYVFLLANPPMTAYRVARQIGKATANTYKAIDSLARRGAVLVEEGENRMCRAVPADEFLQHLERSFTRLTGDTAAALATLGEPAHDERVYKLESVPLILERCRQMLEERAERLAVVDAFPAALDSIRPWVAAAATRGVDVLVQAYKPVDLQGVELVVPTMGAAAEQHWGSQQLNVTIDGREALIALMDNNLTAVIQAVWTNSLYLSCILEAGMMSEHTLHRVRALAGRRDSSAQIKKVLDRHRFFLNTDIPGQKELLSRFAAGKDRNAAS